MLGKKRECVCVCAQVLSPRRRTRGLDAALYVSHVFNRVFAQMDRTGRQLSWNQDRFAILQPSESRKFSLSLSLSFSLLFLIFAQRQVRPSINRRNQSTDPELLVVTFANRSPPSLLFSSFYNLSLSNRGPFRYAQSCRMSTVAPRRERFSICRQLHRYGDICAQDRIICLGVVSSLIVVIERKKKEEETFFKENRQRNENSSLQVQGREKKERKKEKKKKNGPGRFLFQHRSTVFGQAYTKRERDGSARVARIRFLSFLL